MGFAELELGAPGVLPGGAGGRFFCGTRVFAELELGAPGRCSRRLGMKK